MLNFRINYKSVLLVLLITNLAIASAATVKIALVAPFSGPYKAYGMEAWRGAKTALKAVSALTNINGEKCTFELIKFDDQKNPEVAKEVAQKIIAQDIGIVIGNATVDELLVSLDLYARAPLIAIVPTANATQITHKGISNVFLLNGDITKEAEEIARFLGEIKIKNVALFYDNTQYGYDLAKILVKKLDGKSRVVSIYEKIDDFIKLETSNIAEVLKEKNTNAVLIAALYPDAAQLVNKLQHNSIMLPIIVSDAAMLPDFAAAITEPQLLKRVITSFGHATEKFNLNQKEELSAYSMYYYAAIQTIAKAIAETKKFDPQALSLWLHLHTVNTIIGELAWDTNGNIKHAKYNMFIWANERELKRLS